MNPTNTNKINNATPTEKTAEQRRKELDATLDARANEEFASWLKRDDISTERPKVMPTGLAQKIDLLDGMTVGIGQIPITVVPSREKWRSYVSQKGANKGETVYTAFGFREGNFPIGKPVDGYQMFVSVSLAFAPVKK